MATVADDLALESLNINPTLFSTVKDSVENALSMCDVNIRCVGVSATPTQESGIITGMIGVHGKVSGFVSVNMSEHFAITAVSGLLQEQFSKLNSQVIDGAGEITNIVVGGVKSGLSKTGLAFSQITVPSVIVGQNFTIAYAPGLEYLTVTFEHIDEDVIMLEDRMVHVSMSLLTV
ncbi:MAG: chemotaxis protein CheX [Planctomycetota bacterium]